MTNAIGPDVSFYQDANDTTRKIDFEKMKSNGASFVVVRAGQNTWTDDDFAYNWQAAKQAGLPRGSYWFYDSRSSPESQAELWIATIGSDLGELPMWCDFEERYGGAYGTWNHWYRFIAKLQVLAPGKTIGIYTGYYYWLEKTIGIPSESLVWFGQFPLWIARYNATEPLVPAPWTDWKFWQYTDSGEGIAYGVESREIDLNYYNGSAEEFQKEFPMTPEGENEMEATYNCKALYDVKVRPSANTNNVSLGTLAAGTNFQISEIVPDSIEPTNSAKKWGHIIGGMWDGKYTALEYPGNPVPISSYTPIVPTEPPPTSKTITVIIKEDGYQDTVVSMTQMPL